MVGVSEVLYMPGEGVCRCTGVTVPDTNPSEKNPNYGCLKNHNNKSLMLCAMTNIRIQIRNLDPHGIYPNPK